MRVGLVLLVCAGLYLATALYFSLSFTAVTGKVIAADGFGPFETSAPDTVVKLTLEHIAALDTWVHVEADVVDAQGRVLVSLGDEFYYERPDPQITLLKTKVNGTLVVPRAGTYRLVFRSQTGQSGYLTSEASEASTIVGVTVERQNGLPGGHLGMGLALALLGGVLMVKRKTPGMGGEEDASLEAPKQAVFLFGPMVLALSLAGVYAVLLGPASGAWRGDMEPTRGIWVEDGTAHVLSEVPSVREGSLGGPGHLGGDLMAGK